MSRLTIKICGFSGFWHQDNKSVSVHFTSAQKCHPSILAKARDLADFQDFKVVKFRNEFDTFLPNLTLNVSEFGALIDITPLAYDPASLQPTLRPYSTPYTVPPMLPVYTGFLA